MESVAPCISV